MGKSAFRKQLSAPGLYRLVRESFSQLEPESSRFQISQTDCLMSGLAVFALKYPSLLQFDQQYHEESCVRHNLRTLFGVLQAPCDTRLRERLDEIDPQGLRIAFRRLWGALQRGKGLEGLEYLEGHYLLSIDGTGYFSSSQVHCDHCLQRHHRDGGITYSHQMLGAVVVHPDSSEVFSLAPEPIIKSDGSKKNDCERNASKRLLSTIKREHPHLKLIVIEDGLSSNGPHIRLLKSLNYRFILGAKESDHRFLFDWVKQTSTTRQVKIKTESGIHYQFRYLNGVPLNDTHFDVEVNFLEVVETTAKGKTRRFSWVTDIELTDANVMTVMRGGRARWKIENETFNTLKTQGYHFEHNYGHGHHHLSTVLAYLMMLAFLIDQIQQRCCQVFRQAKEKKKSKRALWEWYRSLFFNYELTGWDMMLGALAYGFSSTMVVNDTS